MASLNDLQKKADETTKQADTTPAPDSTETPVVADPRGPEAPLSALIEQDTQTAPAEEEMIHYRHARIRRFVIKTGRGKADFVFTDGLCSVPASRDAEFLEACRGLVPADFHSISRVKNIQNEVPLSAIRGVATTANITEPTIPMAQG